MKIEMSYDKWVDRYKNPTDSRIAHRELNGFFDENKTYLYLYPEPLMNELSQLAYNAVVRYTMYTIVHDTDRHDHFERLYVTIFLNEVSVAFSIKIDHLSHRIIREYIAEQQELLSQPMWSSFKEGVYQQIEHFMREHSPNRLQMVTHLYNTQEE